MFKIKNIITNLTKSSSGIEILDGIKQRVKDIFIENVYLDIISTDILLQFLNEKCKRIHFMHYRVYSQWREVLREGNKDLVFYKIPTGSSFFLYNNTIVHIQNMRGSSSNGNLTYLRGSLDLAQLLKDAREYNRPITNNETEYVNYYRFNVFEYYGDSNYSEVSQGTKSNRARLRESSPNDCEDNICEEILNVYKNDVILNYNKSDLAVTKRSIDPFDDLYYPQEVHDLIIDTNKWLKNRDWFLDRGLPYKRGILLYGTGGTGKSSFAKALGMKFGIPVHQLYLSNMTDSDFKNAWNSAATSSPSIVLLEDFDSVFCKRTPVNPKCVLNFDTVLNTISGIQENSGIILIITTNHIENIDNAIGVMNDDGVSTRPGRIDKVIHLHAMNKENRIKLANKILRTWPEIIDEVVDATDGYTPAQVQETCIQRALQLIKNIENYD